MECVICGGKITSRCRCTRGDCVCENGHSYHWSPFHKEYHEGACDHRQSDDSPDCCTDKKKIDIK